MYKAVSCAHACTHEQISTTQRNSSISSPPDLQLIFAVLLLLSSVFLFLSVVFAVVLVLFLLLIFLLLLLLATTCLPASGTLLLLLGRFFDLIPACPEGRDYVRSAGQLSLF